MQTLDLRKPAFPKIQQFEEKVWRTHWLFCCEAWQYSSTAIQRKYQQYALSKQEFRQADLAFQDTAEQPGHFSTESHLAYVLEPLVSIRKFYGESSPPWADIRKSGQILRLASYAGCLLGYAAQWAIWNFICDACPLRFCEKVSSFLLQSS